MSAIFLRMVSETCGAGGGVSAAQCAQVARARRAHRAPTQECAQELKDEGEHARLLDREGARADRGGVCVGDVVRADAEGGEEGAEGADDHQPQVRAEIVLGGIVRHSGGPVAGNAVGVILSRQIASIGRGFSGEISAK